jgi:hypothetical protein
MKKLLLLLLLLPALANATGWECINRQIGGLTCNTWRWSVPGGWMVATDNGDVDIAMAFIPDAQHVWSGT